MDCEKHLDVYFTGKPLAGKSRTCLSQGLLRLAGNDRSKAQQLLNKAPVKIKTGLDGDAARQLIRQLLHCGWHGEIRRGQRAVYHTQMQSAVAARPAAGNKPLAGRKASGPDKSGSGTAKVAVARLPKTKTETKAPVIAGQKSSVRVRRIYDADRQISLCLPVDWQPVRHLNPNAIMQFAHQQGGAYLIVIRQDKQVFDSNVRLQDYARAVVSAAVGWVKSGKASGDLSRLPAEGGYRTDLAGMAGNVPVQYQISVHESRVHFYCVYLWTAAEDFSRHGALFKSMAASFTARPTEARLKIS